MAELFKQIPNNCSLQKLYRFQKIQCIIVLIQIHKNKELSECTSVSSPIVCIGADTLFKTIKHVHTGSPITIGVVGNILFLLRFA